MVRKLTIFFVLVAIAAGGGIFYIIDRDVQNRRGYETAKTQTRILADNVEQYRMMKRGAYPKDLEELVDNRLMLKIPRDPWGNPCLLEETPNNTKGPARIVCTGVDGVAGNDDDVVHWLR